MDGPRHSVEESVEHSVELRPAIPGDASAIAEVYLASRRVFLPFAPLAHPEPEVRAWIRAVLVPGGGVSVAVVDGTVAGLLAVSRDVEGIGWIDQLYLAPGTTGRGVGTRLLARALEALPRPVRLYTFQANAGARRFYERHGFAAVAFGDGTGNEEGVPDVLYELR
jgi:GNAT superfamily N-acetyltransferase